MAPTRIYVRPALAAIRAGGVRAVAHITGGGLTDNLPRVLEADTAAQIELHSWPLPPVFRWLIAEAGIAEAEALKTLNCGIGMVLVVEPASARSLTRVLEEAGETVFRIGTLVESERPGVHYVGNLG